MTARVKLSDKPKNSLQGIESIIALISAIQKQRVINLKTPCKGLKELNMMRMGVMTSHVINLKTPCKGLKVGCDYVNDRR